MKDRIKISELASYHLQVVKRNLKFGGAEDYIPMRIAFGRSLQVNKHATVPQADQETQDKLNTIKRKELQLTTFEQGQGLIFQALLSQKYQRKIEDDEYVDLITQHIEHGLWIIYNDTDKIKGYDYLVRIVPQMNDLDIPLADFRSSNEKDGILKVEIGSEKQSQKRIEYQINKANNPHFGIIGGSGSGKTYFLKHLLREIRQNSDYETHFIIFDYKDGDIAKDASFVQDTMAEVINVKEKPLPLNIFAGAETNEREQIERANRIVEIVQNVEASIGKVQEQNLYDAILRAYQESSPYPDFRIVRDILQQINPRPDSLTSVLRPLVDLNYFAENTELIYGSWTNKTLIIDIHELESNKELVCFFVLNQIHTELKRLGVAPVNPISGARKLRTVIVIDEAHYFLDNPKRSKILAKMIKDVRSSGGAIILASQSPDDYDTAESDFLELLEFPIILKSTPKSHKFLEQKFSLKSNEAKDMLQELGKLERGEAYILFENKPILVKLT
jgi:ABC-type oligopeptide transport system ATPase subunit